MTMFMPEGTVLATGDRFVQILGFLVDKTCHALLADQLESSDMAAGFGKLSTKSTKNLTNHQIYIHMQKYYDFIIFTFSKQSNHLTAVGQLIGRPINWPSAFGRCC